MRENEIESKVCTYVRKLGGIPYKFVSPARRSVPDRLIVLPNGNMFFIEFKAKNGKPTTGQIREINRLRDLQQTVYVVNDVEQGIAVIDVEMGGFDIAY